MKVIICFTIYLLICGDFYSEKGDDCYNILGIKTPFTQSGGAGFDSTNLFGKLPKKFEPATGSCRFFYVQSDFGKNNKEDETLQEIS